VTRPLRCFERPRAGDVAIAGSLPSRTVVDGWPLSPMTYCAVGETRSCTWEQWVRWCREHAAQYRRNGVDLLQQEAEAALASGSDHA
jgi:hypothetical protein